MDPEFKVDLTLILNHISNTWTISVTNLLIWQSINSKSSQLNSKFKRFQKFSKGLKMFHLLLNQRLFILGLHTNEVLEMDTKFRKSWNQISVVAEAACVLFSSCLTIILLTYDDNLHRNISTCVNNILTWINNYTSRACNVMSNKFVYVTFYGFAFSCYDTMLEGHIFLRITLDN